MIPTIRAASPSTATLFVRDCDTLASSALPSRPFGATGRRNPHPSTDLADPLFLYVGDAGAKTATFERERLASLGVTLDEHGKMPDLVVYRPDKDWLFLMEAASTHGPMDHTRYGELSRMFADSTARRPAVVGMLRPVAPWRPRR